MVEGAWVVIGTAVGGLIAAAGSIFTALVNSYLARDKLDKYDIAATKLLRDMLENGDKWQPLSSLTNVIGAEEQATKELLLMLGARASTRKPTHWGLVSRNPLPNYRNQKKTAED